MMRRIAALLVGLVLVAGAVEAQAVKCTSSKTTRLGAKGAQFVNGVLKGWYVSSDSVAYSCSGFPTARVDTVTVPGPVVHDTVWVKDSTPVPPKDTTPPPPPPPPTDTTKPTGAAVLFSSDWSNGLLDGGKWTRWGDNGILAVVPAPAGFPAGMKNVLQVTMGSSAFDWVETNGKWTLPAIGESRAFRVYMLNAIPTATTGWASTHPIESKGTDGSVAGNFYAMHVGSAETGGIWDFAIDAPPGWPWDHINVKTGRTATTPGPIAKAVTRIEWKWTRVSANGYTLDLRLSDASGKLLYDRTSLYGWEAGPLASFTGTFTLDSWAVTGLRIGSNGGFSLGGQPKVYWGGFAVCADWCGAY